MNRVKLISIGALCGILVVSAATLASTPRAQVVNVSLTNFAITFDPPTVHSGKVTLVSTNEATDLVHEILVVKTDLPVDRLPLKPDGSVNEDSIRLMTIASVEDLGPGKIRALTVDLKPGRYVYFCNQPQHYSVGMRGEINVQP